MYVPSDKLLNNLQFSSTLVSGPNFTVSEAMYINTTEILSLIELKHDEEDAYFFLNTYLPKFEKVENPNVFKIQSWTYELHIVGGKRLYKFFMVTSYFNRFLTDWLRQRSQSKIFIIERDLYQLTREFSIAFDYFDENLIPISKISRENCVISKGRIQYIPYKFLTEMLFAHKSKPSESYDNSTILDEKVSAGDIIMQKIFTNSSPEEINKTLKILKANNIELSHLSKLIDKLGFEKTEAIESNSKEIPKSKKLNDSILSSLSFLSKNKVEEIKVSKKYRTGVYPLKQQIYDFGIFLIVMAENFSEEDYSDYQLTTKDHFRRIEQRFSKDFAELVARMVHHIPDRRPCFKEISEFMKNLIKLKGIEKPMMFDLKNDSNHEALNNKDPLSIERNTVFFFPELFQKLVMVILEPTVYYEVIDLNIEFLIPPEHRAVSLHERLKGKIFLLGGVNSKIVYLYNAEKKTLEEKCEMLCTFERKSFGICVIKDLIFIAGGFQDGDLTGGTELYDTDKNFWKRMSKMVIPCSEPTLCSIDSKFVYKLGGFFPETRTLCQTIERYDIAQNKWQLVEYTLPDSFSDDLTLMMNSQAVSLSDNIIYVFGGINTYGDGTIQTFSIEIGQAKKNVMEEIFEKNSIKERKVPRHKILHLNQTKLPFKDPLQPSLPSICKGEIFTMQWKKTGLSRLISFSNYNWKTVRDIKW